MTMGLLRQNEESRPLVGDMTPLSAPLDIQPVYSNGYINEDSYIDSKFGDSCRQSLTAIPMLDNVNLNDNNEFNLKKRYLRETSSGKCLYLASTSLYLWIKFLFEKINII